MIPEDVDMQIKTHCPVPPSSKAAQFDEVGTKIWNASLRIRQQKPDMASPRLLSYLRVFAFLLIDLAQQAVAKQLEKARENLVRILRTALKTARTCIDSDELDLSARVFERIASQLEHRDPERGYKRNVKNDDDLEHEEIIEKLIAEYHLLRATLTWKQNRLDLSGHWLSKANVSNNCELRTQLAQKKADLMYEIGSACLNKKIYEDAAKWMEKSCDTIDAVDSEFLSEDCIELRTSAVSAWIRALLGLKDLTSIAKASKLVTLLESESGFKMAICVLRLSVLFVETPMQAEEVFNVLLRIIRSSVITEGAFKIIMHQIQRLKDFDAGFAGQALDSILPRLYEMHPKAQSMLEKVVITRVWIAVSRSHSSECLPGLRKVFDEIYETTALSFGPEATHAAQSLMWKNTSSSDDVQSKTAAELWCRLAWHPLLKKAGDLNKSKLARKMILLALARGDTPAAREAYFQMPESGKSAPITKYLMYKVALRSDDVELASDSLEGVLKASVKDASFLYACALEAHQHGDRQQAITVLQKVLEHYGYSAPAGVYLPSLLRCTAAAIMTEMKDKRIPLELALSELCKIFEGAMTQASGFRATTPRSSTKDQYLAELRWFASHTYNLSLQHCGDMQPELLVRLMTVCTAFVGLLRQGDKGDGTLVVRLLLCHFLTASGLIVIGRSEDRIEIALQRYVDVRQQAKAFYNLYHEISTNETIEDEIKASLAAKQFEMLKYDLEAVLKLEHWSDLDCVLAVIRSTSRLLTTMLMLPSDVPRSTTHRSMGHRGRPHCSHSHAYSQSAA